MDSSAEQALGRVGVWSMELRNAGRPGVAEAAAELADRGLTALWIPGLDGSGIFDDTDELLTASAKTYVVLGVLGIWRQEASVLLGASSGAGSKARPADDRGSRGE